MLSREIGHGLGHSARPEQVHFDSPVERSIEAHRGSRMDHDVAARQQCAGGFVKFETVPADIAADGGEATRDLALEAVPELGSQTVEAVVANDLPSCSLCRSEPLTWPDEGDDLAARDTAQQAFDERSS